MKRLRQAIGLAISIAIGAKTSLILVAYEPDPEHPAASLEGIPIPSLGLLLLCALLGGSLMLAIKLGREMRIKGTPARRRTL